MTELGYNYRLSDLQCALGLSQLAQLPKWVARRQEIARRYDAAFAELPGVKPLAVRLGIGHAYHLYVIQVDSRVADRGHVFTALRGMGIGVNVHYLPVHLHPYYRRHFGTGPGLCPVAESAYESILSLPIFPRMSDADVDRVIDAVATVTQTLSKAKSAAA
jgi:perosamine synthetase